MLSTEVIIQQTIIIFAYVAIGWLANKSGLITGEYIPVFSRFVTSVTVPLNLLAITNVETAPGVLTNMAWCFVLVIGMQALATVSGLWLGGRLGYGRSKQVVFAGLCTYANMGFMGLPLCSALLGAEGVVYNPACVLAFNVLFFTVQVPLFRPGEKISLRSFINVLNLAMLVSIVMLAFGWKLPPIAQTVCNNVGGITSPLAMIIVGMMLGEGDLLDVFRDRMSYLVLVIRNLLWPLIVVAVLAVLPLDPLMELALIIHVVTPCGNFTAVFAAQYGQEPALTSRCVLLSTICSIATMPVMLILAQRMLGG